MYGNPCWRAARKSTRGERVCTGIAMLRAEFGQW
jgi:hypothetical protein